MLEIETLSTSAKHLKKKIVETPDIEEHAATIWKTL